MKKFFTKLILPTMIFFSANNFCHAETLTELQNRLNVEAAEYFATKQLNEEAVMAVTWTQSSAEYRALCYQAFNTARRVVNSALKTEHEKPVAIVVDIDETVLQTAEYDAALLGTGKKFSADEWNEWRQAARATAVPGAVESLKDIAEKDVAIFYVSNRREDKYLNATIKNLHNCGFPNVTRDYILLRTDSNNKQARFSEIEQKYDVILYIGDGAKDFPLDTFGKDTAARNAIIDAHKNNFGAKFIALPNPIYGEFESALATNYNNLSADEKISARMKNVKAFSPADSKISTALKNSATAKNTSQIILVIDHNLALWNKNSAGDWEKDFETFCGYGSGGLSEHRREGDASTPVGSFPILYAFGVPENPGTSLEYKQITENSYLSAENETYNTWIETETPLEQGEHMIEVYQYAYGMNIGFNINPAVVGRGSAVFLHCKGLGRWTTAAGVCVREDDMIQLLKKTKSGAQIIIVPKVDDIAKF